LSTVKPTSLASAFPDSTEKLEASGGTNDGTFEAYYRPEALLHSVAGVAAKSLERLVETLIAEASLVNKKSRCTCG
jgi:hypothetical protein